MIVQPHSIPPEGKEVRGSDPAEVLELREDDVAAVGPLTYHLRLQVAGPELIAAGSVHARFRMHCVRCGAWFEKDVGESDFMCAIPVPEEDVSVDLTPEMREAIILGLSSHPVCRKACRGLCPQCGQDLNAGECECAKPQDVRWSALNSLEL